MLTFIHVNKCGGKSINWVLSKHFKNYQEIHGLVGKATTKTQGAILFVRDPIERFISSFYYYQQRKGFLSHDLDDFVDRIRRTPSYRNSVFKLNLHFGYSLSSYVTKDVAECLDFFFVGRTSTIKKDFERLMCKLNYRNGTAVQLPHLNRTKRPRRKYLSDENVTFLKELYASDYEIIQTLCRRGYLPNDYYDTIINKTKFIY